jgi:glycosyltransferase 2 family protein
MRTGPALRALIGAAVSVVAILLVLRGIDLAEVGQILRNADLRWMAFAALLSTMDLSFRGLRWQRLLRPIARIPYLHVFGYLLIGYLANNILPARLGELVRSHYLGDREGVSRASALGTVVVERVVDLVAVVAIASASLLVLSVRGVVASAVYVGAGIAGLFLVILAVGIVAHRLPGADRVLAILERWPRVRELGRSLQGGLQVAGRPRTLAEALITSGAAWTCSILTFAAVGQSIGLQLTIGEAALIGSGVALASAVPAGPSNLGTFELAAVEIGKAIGIPAETAFALALLTHATILVVTSIGGVIAFSRVGWRRVPDVSAEETPSA